jgi:eukaryotic-like serine/threonine-protein kinase
MASPTTTEEFLDMVRKSCVIEEKRLNAHVEKLRAAGKLPAEPGKLAGVLVIDGLLTHFQAEQIMLGKWRRFTIGKYKVLERLGSGGMGSVYLCEHKLMRRRVAVKVLPTAKANDPSALERFYREARAVAALDHDNIVHAYDIDQDENLHFLVMEYVDGASFQEIIKKTGPMEPLRAAHYIHQAAIGLQHASTAGLVHRDIKPGNILVDREGTVKILDMGLARFFNDEEDILTKKYDENVLGTADYLAPEQALDSHGVDIRADIYSLGATFYYVLTGRTPFNEGTVAQKLIWHQTRQPKPIRTLRPQVPEGLAAIIDKMMAKDPAQRYQTPAELAEALAPWTQTPIGPPPEAEMPRLSLAATGVAPGENTVVGSAAPSTPASGSRKNWQVPPSSHPSKPPARPTDPRASRAAASPPTVRATNPGASTGPASDLQPTLRTRPSVQTAVAPEPQPAPDEDGAPWEHLTTDTEDPSARVDTAERSSRKRLSRSRPSSKSLRQPAAVDRRRFWWVAGAVAAVVLVLLFVAWLKFSGTAPKTQPVIKVNKASGQPGDYRTIREALDRAQSGDRIVVAGGQYEEQLVLRRKTGITIEAGEGEVVLVPPRTLGSNEPLLKLYDAGDVHFKGIKLKGAYRLQHLVALFGHSPGLTLENLQFEEFTQSAVLITNCAGKSGQPVRLEGLETTGAGVARPGVEFRRNAEIIDPNLNNHIWLANCRFQGNAPIKFNRSDVGADVTWDGKPLPE